MLTRTLCGLTVLKNCTVEVKGKKSVIVQTTRAENQCCTVTLCITTNGQRLYVVLRGNRIPNKVFPRESVCAQEKGWMIVCW